MPLKTRNWHEFQGGSDSPPKIRGSGVSHLLVFKGIERRGVRIPNGWRVCKRLSAFAFLPTSAFACLCQRVSASVCLAHICNPPSRSVPLLSLILVLEIDTPDIWRMKSPSLESGGGLLTGGCHK